MDLKEGTMTARAARKYASKMIGVSEGSIAKARYIMTRNPELAERVRAGEISLDKAHKMVKGLPAAPRERTAREIYDYIEKSGFIPNVEYSGDRTYMFKRGKENIWLDVFDDED